MEGSGFKPFQLTSRSTHKMVNDQIENLKMEWLKFGFI